MPSLLQHANAGTTPDVHSVPRQEGVRKEERAMVRGSGKVPTGQEGQRVTRADSEVCARVGSTVIPQGRRSRVPTVT